jgi:predicted ATP-binding protein involved in virulence
MTKKTIPLPTYFKSLTVENVKCFRGKQVIDLSDGNGKYAQWTVILGDNNTGKTTLLRCLADLEPTLGITRNYWAISNGADISKLSIRGLIIYGYGTARRMGISTLSEKDNEGNTASLFSDNITLINAEEWLLQTDYASKNGVEAAISRLDKIKQVLTSGILPDVTDFRFTTTEELKSFVEFKTDYGWVRVDGLGYGYQTMIAWMVDLAKRLFDRYPDSNNPLAEPAIVLIDEAGIQYRENISSYELNVDKF